MSRGDQSEQNEQLANHAARISILESERDTLRKERRADLQDIYGELKMLNCNVAKLAQQSSSVESVKDRVEKLELWRNYITGGAVVTWAVIGAICFVGYDWIKAHVSTILEIKSKE